MGRKRHASEYLADSGSVSSASTSENAELYKRQGQTNQSREGIKAEEWKEVGKGRLTPASTSLTLFDRETRASTVGVFEKSHPTKFHE
uniref:Uncharacterized protein n=1 Tax=Vespula pensylvanica TaxID=30213 RepID=A0A834JT64_VESPE|nr:hypothetical protein H0235_016759 [Vespula pensylvanica]